MEKLDFSKQRMGIGQRDCLLIVLCCFLPPLAVFIKCKQQCTNAVLINILLTVLGFIPGVIHGIWFIYKWRNVVAGALGL